MNPTKIALRILNGLLKADPVATNDLFTYQVNLDLSACHDVPVYVTPDGQLRFLGIINGLLDEMGSERIAIVSDQGGDPVVAFVALGDLT